MTYPLRLFSYPHSVDLLPCAEHSNLRPTHFCRFPGVFAESFDLIIRQSRARNLTVSYHKLPPNNYEPWDYFESKLANGTLDTGLTCYTAAQTIQQKFIYGRTAVYSTGVSVLASIEHVHTPFYELKRFTSVFEPTLWIAVLTGWIAVEFYRRQLYKRPGATLKVHKVLLVLFSTIMTWFSMDLYANGILTRLMINANRPLFHDARTLAKMVDAGRVKVALYTTGEIWDRLQNVYEFTKYAEDTNQLLPRELLARALHKNAPMSLEAMDALPPDQLQSLINANVVILQSATGNIALSTELCHTRVVSVQEDLGDVGCHFIFGSHTPEWVRNVFDASLWEHQDMLETLSIRYERFFAVVRNQTCGGKLVSNTNPGLRKFQFKMPQFVGASFLFSTGIVVAFCFLVIERFCSQWFGDLLIFRLGRLVEFETKISTALD